MRWNRVVPVFFAVPLTFIAQSAPVNVPEHIVPELSRFIESDAASDRFSGDVLLEKSGVAVFEHAYGFANKSANRANTLETVFDLGSMPKMFTAIAIAQLVESGKLSYSDHVGMYLPDYPNKTVRDEVTIHQLLTHTAGMGNYFRPGFREKRLKSIREYVEFIANEPLVGRPGERFEYSNSGYVVLGAIIEKVSKQDFYEYIGERIFKPAQMEHTGYYTRDELPHSVAVAYSSGGGVLIRKPAPMVTGTSRVTTDAPQQQIGMSPPNQENGPRILQEKHANMQEAPQRGEAPLRSDADEWKPYRGSPAGGAYSTVHDMKRFADALLNGRLISKASVNLVTSGKVATRVDGPMYGYGFFVWNANGARIIGHGGGAPGVNTMLQMYPDLGYTFIALSNYDPPAAETAAAHVQALLTCSNAYAK